MIITSVVPPELPMELSLAVTNSLAALSRNLVFCTEPFRIPYAGKLDVRTTQSVSINNSESDWYGTRIYDDGDDSDEDGVIVDITPAPKSPTASYSQANVALKQAEGLLKLMEDISPINFHHSDDKKTATLETSSGKPNLDKAILDLSTCLWLSLIFSVMSDSIKPGEIQLILIFFLAYSYCKDRKIY